MGKTKILACILFLSGLLCAQSPNGSILQIQNAGTPIATFTAFGMINCSTGLTCTYSGGKVNITATATGTVTGTGTAGRLVQWTAPSALGNADLSGDCTTSGSLAIICTKTNSVAFATSATTDTTNATNISSGTLAVARGGSGVGTLTGIIKGNGTSAFTAALAADAVGLFSGCSGTQYLGADGACHALATVATSGSASDLSAGTLAVARGGSGVGTLTGIIKGNGTSAFTAAVASDVVGLFSGCSGTQYLGADGACHAAGGSAWSAITDPSGDQTLAMGVNKTCWKGNSQTFCAFYYDPASGFGITTDTTTGPAILFSSTAPQGFEYRNGKANTVTEFRASNSSTNGYGVFQGVSGTSLNQGSYFRNIYNTGDSVIGTGIISPAGSGGTDLFLVKASGQGCIGNNSGCIFGDTAQFTVELNSAFNIGTLLDSDTAKPAVVIRKGSPQTTLSMLNSYLLIGRDEFNTNSYRAIAFGYCPSNATNCPTYLAAQETSTSGNTFDSFSLYGRLVTTDTAPPQRQTWNRTKTALTNNTNTSFIDIPASAGSVAGGIIKYQVEVDDGTNFQVTNGMVAYSCANKAGTMTANVGTATTTSQVATSGTHAVTFATTTGTAKCTVQVNSNSSLTPTTNRINYSVENFSTINDITPL